MGWAAPVANLAGALGGALIGRSGQNAQLKAQERATNAQIALERERDAARTSRYNQAYADYQKKDAEYNMIRRALLGHYGVNLGGGGEGGGAPAPAAAPPPQVGTQGVSLGQLMSGGASAE